MRIRSILIAALLGAAVVVGVGTSAYAAPSQTSSSSQTSTSSTTSSTSHESTSSSSFNGSAEKECVEKLEQGKKIDDCQKAPSPILPAKNELIWGTISFLVLLTLLYKFAWPGIKSGMAARTERIEGDLSAADQAKADAEHILEEYRAQLADARNESARIIEEARQQADALRKEQEQRLQTELAQMRERAAADVEAAKQQAIADLRNEVATLAIGAAEVVVQRSLDRSTQEQLVENYINQVLSRSN